MKELLNKLKEGVDRSSLSKSELIALNPLFKKKLLKDEPRLYLSTKYRFGTIDVIPSGTGFLVQDSNDKDILIESYNLKGARKGDFVLVKRDFKSKGRPKAEVIYIIEYSVVKTLAYLTTENGNIVAYDFKFEQKVPLKTKQKALKQLPEHTVVVIDNTKEDLVEILGVISDPLIDERICLYKAGRSEHFSKAIEKEVKSYGDSIDKSFYPKRLDLTHLDFITIDPKSAKDFDDAIYYDKAEHTLYVAIADVTAYVHPHMAVDDEARKRGFTIYFPHKSIPMLPRALSENLCSLMPHVDRLAYVFKMTLNQSTNAIRKFELFEAIINSKRRFNYDEIDVLFETNQAKDDAKYFDFLKPLSHITQKWRTQRLSEGFDFDNGEQQLVLDENLLLQKTYIEEQTLSHQLIEECMLKTNQCAASYFHEGIFRIHEIPSAKSIDNLLTSLEEIGIVVDADSNDIHSLIATVQAKADTYDMRDEVDRLIIRSLKRAQYAYHNKGHFGLGFDAYTHFTSPIRRYSDLILHRYLKVILAHDSKQEQYIKGFLPALTVQITNLEELAKKTAWEYEDRVFARWADKHVGEVFKAVVVDLHPTKPPIAKLHDDIEGARIFLEESDGVELFEKVEIEILGVNLATAKIYAKVTQRSTEDV